GAPGTISEDGKSDRHGSHRNANLTTDPRAATAVHPDVDILAVSRRLHQRKVWRRCRGSSQKHAAHGRNFQSLRRGQADGGKQDVRALPSGSRTAGRPQGGSSMAVHLRVYPSAQEEDYDALPAPTVRVTLGDLLPLVALAQRHNYLWLRDFLDDEVR